MLSAGRPAGVAREEFYLDDYRTANSFARVNLFATRTRNNFPSGFEASKFFEHASACNGRLQFHDQRFLQFEGAGQLLSCSARRRVCDTVDGQFAYRAADDKPPERARFYANCARLQIIVIIIAPPIADAIADKFVSCECANCCVTANLQLIVVVVVCSNHYSAHTNSNRRRKRAKSIKSINEQRAFILNARNSETIETTARTCYVVVVDDSKLSSSTIRERLFSARPQDARRSALPAAQIAVQWSDHRGRGSASRRAAAATDHSTLENSTIDFNSLEFAWRANSRECKSSASKLALKSIDRSSLGRVGRLGAASSGRHANARRPRRRSNERSD